MRPGLILTLGLCAAAAGCGGDDQTTTAPTVSVPTVPSTTLTTEEPPATTTEAEPDGGDGGNGAGEPAPQPGSGSGAENALIAAAAVLTGDAAADQACGTYVTEAFIQQSYGGEANCIAEREQAVLAKSIMVGPEDDVNAATITVVPRGGPYDGAKVTVSLVVEDGGYRVDALKAHVPAGP